MSVIVLAGASGAIGSALRTRLLQQGHAVRQLVRREPTQADEVRWDPDAGDLPGDALQDATAVVNLGGVGVGDKRWTPEYRQLITASRVQGTALLARALANWSGDAEPPRLVQASAVGYYGDAGEVELTEDAAQGEGFLAHVCQAWEQAAEPAVVAGVPVAFIRTGIVLDPNTGALARMLPLLRLGLAGPLGSGTQWWPWITLTDEVRAIEHLIGSRVTGPVNLSSPNPARNRDLTRTLARQLGRPAFVPAPEFGLRLVLGEFAAELTASQRVVPEVLLEDGFTFTSLTVQDAAEHLFG